MSAHFSPVRVNVNARPIVPPPLGVFPESLILLRQLSSLKDSQRVVRKANVASDMRTLMMLWLMHLLSQLGRKDRFWSLTGISLRSERVLGQVGSLMWMHCTGY